MNRGKDLSMLRNWKEFNNWVDVAMLIRWQTEKHEQDWHPGRSKAEQNVVGGMD